MTSCASADADDIIQNHLYRSILAFGLNIRLRCMSFIRRLLDRQYYRWHSLLVIYNWSYKRICAWVWNWFRSSHLLVLVVSMKKFKNTRWWFVSFHFPTVHTKRYSRLNNATYRQSRQPTGDMDFLSYRMSSANIVTVIMFSMTMSDKSNVSTGHAVRGGSRAPGRGLAGDKRATTFNCLA